MAEQLARRSLAVLVVDDHADVRTLLKLTIDLANRGLRVVGEAADGASALDMIGTLDPDVMVLDQMMPGMTGLAVVEELRRRDHDLPVVLCSAHLDDHLRSAATALGVGECIDKNDIRAVPGSLWRVTGRAS